MDGLVATTIKILNASHGLTYDQWDALRLHLEDEMEYDAADAINDRLTSFTPKGGWFGCFTLTDTDAAFLRETLVRD